jgi:hypothetical protein
VFRLFTLELGLHDDVLQYELCSNCRRWLAHIDSVRALLDNVGDGTHSPGWQHDLVVVNERIFVDRTEDVSTGNVVSDLELGGVEVPRDASVESLGVDTTCRA